MNTIKVKTISDQLWLFMLQYSYNEVMLSKEIDISPSTISHRLKYNDWRFDEKRAIRILFKRYNIELVGEVKEKVKIIRSKEK